MTSSVLIGTSGLAPVASLGDDVGRPDSHRINAGARRVSRGRADARSTVRGRDAMPVVGRRSATSSTDDNSSSCGRMYEVDLFRRTGQQINFALASKPHLCLLLHLNPYNESKMVSTLVPPKVRLYLMRQR